MLDDVCCSCRSETDDDYIKKSEKIVIGNENVSLQDSFKKFRTQKLKERQILNHSKTEIYVHIESQISLIIRDHTDPRSSNNEDNHRKEKSHFFFQY
jgi:hypothetical protein